MICICATPCLYHLLWRSYSSVWEHAVSVELLSECELAEDANLRWLPQSLLSMDVLRMCDGNRARAKPSKCPWGDQQDLLAPDLRLLYSAHQERLRQSLQLVP